MPRVLRYLLALTVISLTAAFAFAQPGGGGTGSSDPTNPASRPPIIEDFQDILDNPEAAMGELIQIVQREVENFLRENRALVDENLDALPAALGATTTRVLALALGALALIFPPRTKVWAWLFLGAVIGLIVAQIPLGDDVRRTLFTSDLDFLMAEPQATIAMIAVGALAGLIVLSPLYFFTLALAGVLVGITIALRVVGYDPDLAAPAMAIGGFLGFILMAYAVGRGSLLVPIAVGSALIVFGLGIGVSWMVPLMVASGLVTAARSSAGKQRLKRTSLPILTLAEGRVNLDNNKARTREHLHEIIPTMADDRDNPLIKR